MNANTPSIYPFTEAEADKAARDWGCNCGPTALAFALRCKLERARDLIPGFADKRFASPTMMAAALTTAERTYDKIERLAKSGTRLGVDRIDALGALINLRSPVLARAQWHGPWTEPGTNPRWAYAHTHWVSFFGPRMVFDVNGGAMEFARWETEIVPALMKQDARRDGTYSFTHIWHLHAVGAGAEVSQ